MKLKKSSDEQNKKAVVPAQLTTSSGLSRIELHFTPSPDEVAMRAYYNFVSKGSEPGHDLQHWLEAETQLLAERGRSLTPEYQDRT